MDKHYDAVPLGKTIGFEFNGYVGTSGASGAISNLAVGDVTVVKNWSSTRTATDGISTTVQLGGLTGCGLATIDTNDNTHSGFFSVGDYYSVALGPITIDSQTIYKWLGSFRLVLAEAVAGAPNVNSAYYAGTTAAGTAGVPDVNVTQYGGTNGTFTAGKPRVLLTPGTGTGEIALTTGAVTFANTSIQTVGTVTSPVVVGTNNDKGDYALSAASVSAVQSGLATQSGQTTINNNVLAVGTAVNEVGTAVDALGTSVAAVGTQATLARKYLTNKQITYYTGTKSGTMETFDDDDNTVIGSAPIYQSQGTSDPYAGTAAINHRGKFV